MVTRDLDVALYNAVDRDCTKLSTTDGSAKVEISPKLDTSPSAILRNIRRMIFPDRVFGKPGAK
jgi:hypothetical protein